MKILWLVILFAALNQSKQTNDYVCMPCGYACDEASHNGPGNCKSCGMALVKKSDIRFTNITLDQLCRRLIENPNVLLLDVRSLGEFDGSAKEVPSFGHFRKAVNINVVDLESRIQELKKYKDREVIVYCTHSHRSPSASYMLGMQGFTNVKNMSGGVSTFQSGQACLKEEFVFHKE